MSATETTQKTVRGRKLNFVVNCNGSDIGNGNGNLNMGSGGETGTTGTTGSTGFTGPTGNDMVCDSFCTRPCEQFVLDIVATPSTISRIGQQLTWIFSATNVSGTRVTKPIVISSSFLGTLFLSDEGVDAGATVSITIKNFVQASDLMTPQINNVCFVAYGVATGIPGAYNPGERISPIVIASVDVNMPILDVSGNIAVFTGTNISIGLTLILTNSGPVNITAFSFDFANLFGPCAPILNGNPDDMFELDGTTVKLKITGIIKNDTVPLNLLIETFNCASATPICASNLCEYVYSYQAEGTPLFTNSVQIPITYV